MLYIYVMDKLLFIEKNHYQISLNFNQYYNNNLRQKLGICWIQVRRAAAVEISLWTR